MPSIEKRLERRLRDEVKKRGGMAIKMGPGSGITGLPDRLVVLHSLGSGLEYTWVELKDTGAEPTPGQESMHRRLRAMGCRVLVIDSDEKLNEFLNEKF